MFECKKRNLNIIILARPRGLEYNGPATAQVLNESFLIIQLLLNSTPVLKYRKAHVPKIKNY